jgi:PAS domain S-box-containing protein
MNRSSRSTAFRANGLRRRAADGRVRIAGAYAVAVLGPWLMLLLWQWQNTGRNDEMDGVLFVMPVAVAAVLGGMAPALIASLLGTGLMASRVMTPDTWRDADWLELLALPAVGVMIGGVSVLMHRTRRRLEEDGRHLMHAQAIARLGAWTGDVRKHTITASAQAAAILGLPAGVYAVEEFFSRVFSDDLRTVRKRWQEALRTGFYEIEHRVNVDGRIRWVSVNAEVEFDGAGHPTTATGVTQDITARKEAEARLRDREEVYGAIVNQAGDGIALIDVQTLRFVEFNEMSCRRIGYTRSEFAQLTLADIQVGIAPEEIRSRVARDAAAGEAYFETRHRHRDGSVREVHVSARVVRLHEREYMATIWRDITAAKQAEAASRERDATYRAAIESSADGFWIADLEGRLLEANEAYVKRSGYDRAELLTKRISDLEAHETAAEIATRIERIVAGGPNRFETLHRAKDGTIWPAELTVAHWPIAGGRLFAFIRDVTRRQRSEALLRVRLQLSELAQRESVAGLLRGTLDAAELLTGSRSGFAHLIDSDQKSVRLAAWSTNALRKVPETGAPAPVSDVRASVECLRTHRPAFRTAGEGRGPELTVPVLNGPAVMAVFGVNGKSTDYTTEDAEALQELGSVAMDFVGRKNAEETLRASEERFREVVENITEVFWMTDVANRRIMYVSPAFEKVWGRSCDELYHAPDLWRNSLHPEDRGRVIAAMQAKQVLGTYDETYRIVRPDGKIRWVRDQAYPIRDRHGEVRRIVGVAEDITERKDLERQFLRAQRLEAIGTLASGIAHDMNNILAPMLMIPPLLRERVVDPADRALLEILEQGAQRGAGVVKQLLTFSRGVQGERGPVQVKHLLKEMADIMRETFPRDIVVTCRTAPELLPVTVDPTQLHQVLMNLCVNARDAMPQGGELSLEARNVTLDGNAGQIHPAALPGPYVVMVVSDTGQGIAPEIVERIFDPFFTTKDLGKGTGLGLSTVLGIVKGHGGFIIVESEPGHGAAFRVYLPAAAPTGVAGGSSPSRAPAVRGQGELVLVVDDESSVREALRQVLEKHGYRVVAAGDGRDALAAFAQHREAVRVVLTDVMMPTMNGAALARRLRELSPQVRIIVTTGLVDAETQRELADLGITELVRKPFDVREVLEVLRREVAAAAH